MFAHYLVSPQISQTVLSVKDKLKKREGLRVKAQETKQQEIDRLNKVIDNYQVVLHQLYFMYENTELRRVIKYALSENFEEAIYDLNKYEKYLNKHDIINFNTEEGE